MPEGCLTSASSLRCLPDKTAGRNNVNEQESTAILDDSGLDLDEPVPAGTICQSDREGKGMAGEFPDEQGLPL